MSTTPEIVAEPPRNMTILLPLEVSGVEKAHDDLAKIMSDRITRTMILNRRKILSRYGWEVSGAIMWMFDRLCTIVERMAAVALADVFAAMGKMSGDEITALLVSAKQRQGVVKPPVDPLGTKESG